jgi:hypothetical protein
MPVGTKYAPAKKSDYGAKDLNAALTGTKFIAAASQETTHDFLISEDHLIDGAQLITVGANAGDKVKCQVIDKDNVLGYGQNVVLGEYVKDWYLDPSSSKQLEYESNYPAKIYGGLYLRTVYTSTGAVPVTVIVNYLLHKVLW